MSQFEILQLLKVKPGLNAANISKIIGISRSPVNHSLRHLVFKGFISHTTIGSNKTHYYYLTTQGNKYLTEVKP